jgi:hypothetical protein
VVLLVLGRVIAERARLGYQVTLIPLGDGSPPPAQAA